METAIETVRVDGMRLHAQFAPPSDDSNGVMIGVHGLGDHSQHFDILHSPAARRRFAVAAFDLPGHGQSPGRKGHAKSYDSLLRAIGAMSRQCVDRYGDCPQWIVGHSMGGNLVTNYLLRQNEIAPDAPAPAGAILYSPMLMPPVNVTRPQIFAAWLTGYLLPSIRVHKDAPIEKLTADPAMQDRIARDGLRHGKLSIYLATQLLAQGRWAVDHAREIDVPVLIMDGEADEMVDRDATAGASTRIGRNATHVTWPGGRHDLLHDVDRGAVIERTFTWLESVSGLARAA